METSSTSFISKQYNKQEACGSQNQAVRQLSGIQNYDEPIDLTFTHRTEQKSYISKTLLKPREMEMLKNDFVPKKRGRRRKFTYTQDGRLVLLPNGYEQPNPNVFPPAEDIQNSESKQTEVLKAAKSLFSKRTRTLYHWMYPNAPKQQIKSAVASSWESLGSQEKEFYISQVLGRFGFPQCSLMINPQLGGIKELPPLPDTQDFISTASELQNAISSILPDNLEGTENNDFDEAEKAKKLKRKQGRPNGTKNKKFKSDMSKSNIAKDFQDDPELSKELEQFANIFDKNNK